MQLKNTSEHRPKGMIIDVAEKDAKALIKSGEFVKLTKELEEPKTQGAKDLPGVPNDITDDEAAKADREAAKRVKEKEF